MKSSESSPSATGISPHPESPTVRANEHSPSKEAVNQAIPFVEEPTTKYQEQEKIYSSEEEISETRKKTSGRTLRRPRWFKDNVM